METTSKLELKDIVGYLPYGLFVMDSKGKSIYTFDYHPEIKTCKPILRPMSDLSKPIVVDGKEIVPLQEILSILDFDSYRGIYTSFAVKEDRIFLYIWGEWILEIDFNLSIINSATQHNTDFSFQSCLKIHDFLNQHHFDYRCLITKGLAIDINTITK